MDRWYGRCSISETLLASCFGKVVRYDTASSAGGNCPKWLLGGKHGGKR